MHGYTAALILPEGIVPANKELEIRQLGDHNYAAILIERPFDPTGDKILFLPQL